MSIRLFFDKTAIVKRQRPIVGFDRSRLSATATVDAHFQKLDIDTVQKIGGVFGEEYVLFVDPSLTIRQGDRVVCKNDNSEYTVKEVLEGEMFGIEHIKQVYITKYNES